MFHVSKKAKREGSAVADIIKYNLCVALHQIAAVFQNWIDLSWSGHGQSDMLLRCDLQRVGSHFYCY